MAQIKADTLNAIAFEFYGYRLSDDAARQVANAAGGILEGARALRSLKLGEVEPPFGYATMVAEANRIRTR